ncbi:hypothetical protein JOE56_002205 [Brevibacterium paucivorans]|uniref:Uncharacterized protein n=1 Tax=Brevibacterium paucivorans TaxID=170994 RepID=A0ABS2SR81_9MICO|nr:hypothetical protein [Brevibacterium paucivorans]
MSLPSLCSAAAMQCRGPRGWPGPSSGAHGRVAGLLDGGQDLRVVEVALGGDDQPAGLSADLDAGDTGDLADLLAD